MNELSVSEGRRGTPWSFWATIGFSSIVGAAFFITGIVVVVAFFLFEKAHNPGIETIAFMKSLSSNGFCLAICTIIAAPICTALVVLFVKFRKNFPIRDYLCFRKTTKGEFVKWLLFTVIFMVCSDTLTHFLNRPIVPPFMIDVYKTARFTPALYVALLLMAPVYEEIFFRGFIFQGIRYSRLGTAGAVILTTLGWSILHLQYDIYGIASIIVFGFLLGIARLKSNSIYVPIAMHSLNNLVATIQAAIFVKFLS